MQCKAKSKTTGERCRQHAVQGRTVCRMHGGKSPRGLASATLKDGRRSKYLPRNLLERYRTALTDPNLRSLNDEIALVDARLNEVLESLRSASGGAADVAEVGASWAELKAAQEAGDNERAARFWTEHDRAVAYAGGVYAGWREALDLVERRRRLADTETKRLAADRQSVPLEDALWMTDQIADAIVKYVPDPAARQAISETLIRFTGGPIRLPDRRAG